MATVYRAAWVEQITRQYFFRVRAVSSVFCPHLRTSKPANLRNWKTASLLFHMKLQNSCGTKYVMMLDATNDNRTRLNQSHTCISYPLMTRLFISERYDNYLSRIYYLFFCLGHILMQYAISERAFIVFFLTT